MSASAPLTSSAPVAAPPVTMRALFRIALYYGVAGFGGGYSVLAQLRRDLVDRRGWLSADDFLVLAELSKSLPGTPATSLLALLGQRIGGARGGVVAACAFLVPSMILMIACGAAYSSMRSVSGLTLFFDGMNAAMVGVVAAVTLELSRSALRSPWEGLLAMGCATLLVLGLVKEPVLAIGAVSIGLARTRLFSVDKPTPAPAVEIRTKRGWQLPSLPIAALSTGGAMSLFGKLAALVQLFGPVSLTTFGGGMAMIPEIERLVVVDRHWLGTKAFADAIALGQITPGPVAICSTFIGYRVAGIAGALAATVAMFAPTVALALIVGRSVARFHDNPHVRAALRALAPAVIGMLLAAVWSLGHAGIEKPLDGVVAVLVFTILARLALSPLWALVGGGLVHLAAARFFSS